MNSRNRFMVGVLAFVIMAALMAAEVNTGGHEGLVRTLSAKTLGKTGIYTGIGGLGSREYEFITGPGGSGRVADASGNNVARITPTLISTNLFFGYGLTRTFDLALNIPYHYDDRGFGEAMHGLGDIELAAKLYFPLAERGRFYHHAYYLAVALPTGQNGTGYFPRHIYYLENEGTNPTNDPFTGDFFNLRPLMLWTFDFGEVSPIPISLHINFGGVLSGRGRQNALLGAAAVELTPIKVMTLYVDFAGESRFSSFETSYDIRDVNKDPLWLTPGLRLCTPNGFFVNAAFDWAVSSRNNAYSAEWDKDGFRYSTRPAPMYGVQASIGWRGWINPDDDKDGIKNYDDKCRYDPEDKDEFQDDDGCPDPDNDNDGILDTKDKCPNAPSASDGCPVYDKDGDGLVDEKDKCPDQPEDKDSFEDEDGCPDLDNDKDGLVDKVDECPNKPEDIDNFWDEDGCPDPDNDKDGIPDSVDKCPTTPGEPINNGCPQAKTNIIKRGRLILKGVNFETASTELTQASYAVLQKVLRSLQEWPEVKIEIRGHTDSVGDAAYNKDLSQRRAESVMRYLTDNNVKPSRMKAIGLGEESPIATNRTAQGRAQNRRVEIVRID